MCRNVYAPGSRDLCIDIIPCNDPNCPMRPENTIPMNEAAAKQRRKSGLAEHPDGWKPGESMEDVMLRQLRKRTAVEQASAHAHDTIRRMFGDTNHPTGDDA